MRDYNQKIIKYTKSAITGDFQYFFKKASKSVRDFEQFAKKNKKILEEYERLEQEAIRDKFVVAELAKDEFAKKLKLKKTKIVIEDKTIEVRVGKGDAKVFNKSIYKF